MKQAIVYIWAGMVLAGCGGRQATVKRKPVTDSLMELVMEGHDAGMAGVGKAERAGRSLTHVMDSLGKAPRAAPASTQAFRRAKTALDSASGRMDRWMQGFDMDMPGMDSAAKINYLEANLAAIRTIDDSLNGAVRMADSLLKNVH